MVELESLDGNFIADRILLKWKAQISKAKGSFIVEGSSDGVSFSEIGVLPIKDVSSSYTEYSFSDKTPYNGINYYRLKFTNVDGYTTALRTIPVNTMFPEAVSPDSILCLKQSDDGSMSILVESPLDQEGELQVVNAKGSILYRQQLILGSGVNTIEVRSKRLFEGRSCSFLLFDRAGELVSRSSVQNSEEQITALLN